MKPKLIAVLLLIVLLPLASIGWLSVRLSRFEREATQRRFEQLLLAQLHGARSGVAELLANWERQLLELAERSDLNEEALRDLTRATPLIRQTFWLDAEGRLRYPDAGRALSQAEEQFLARTEQIWRDNALFLDTQNSGATPEAASASGRSPAGHGWHATYWGRGLNLLFWQRRADGEIVGAEIDRVRLLAEIIAALPDTNADDPRPPEGRIELLDAAGQALYQWGNYAERADAPPLVMLPLHHPLSSWKLTFHAPPQLYAGSSRGALFGPVAGLTALGLALIGLVIYFYRESARDMRAAAQRVTFVNQVSHELKTPLTNIRMYAELLERELADREEDEKSTRWIEIIVTESQRLSRLIGNILTFSRQQRQTLKLHPAAGVIDETVAMVIERFRPTLAEKGVAVAFAGAARRVARFDADALDQILGNLLNNVEKYAAHSGELRITSRQEDDRAIITVTDAGPGIPPDQRERVFAPFVRLDDRLTASAGGAGIGLSLARELARLHGGDLTLPPTMAGAHFQLVLRTEPESSDESVDC